MPERGKGSTHSIIPPPAVQSRRVWPVLSGSILVLLLVGWIDLISGVHARVFPLYYGPMAWAALKVSRNAGIALALLSTVLWVVAMVLGGAPWSLALFALNIVTQGFSFLLIATLIGSLADRFKTERELSRRDNLTKLPNSRSFYELSELLVAGTRRSQRPLTLAYVDLDNFKQVNDKQGHLEGDRALVEAARVMRKSLRGSDVVARLGGDEFAVLMPDTDLEHATLALVRLSETLAAAMKAKKWPITASIGAITYLTPPDSVEEAIHLADELMYRVKAEGKNSLKVESSGTFVAELSN